MKNSKKGFLTFQHGVKISKEKSSKNIQEEEDMEMIPYAFMVGSLMYVLLCTRPNICLIVEVANRFQSNPGPEDWVAVK